MAFKILPDELIFIILMNIRFYEILGVCNKWNSTLLKFLKHQDDNMISDIIIINMKHGDVQKHKQILKVCKYLKIRILIHIFDEKHLNKYLEIGLKYSNFKLVSYIVHNFDLKKSHISDNTFYLMLSSIGKYGNLKFLKSMAKQLKLNVNDVSKYKNILLRHCYQYKHFKLAKWVISYYDQRHCI